MFDLKQVYFPPKNKKIRVAFFSNGPNLPTGYAKVIREITSRLNKYEDFELIIINENMFNAEPTTWNGIPMVGLNVKVGPNGVHKERIFEAYVEIIKHYKPDITVFLEDSFTLANFGFHNIASIPTTRVFYMPLDGKWIPSTGLPVVRTMDKLVAMSRFTQDSLAIEGFDSDVIWHGVDLDMFTPVSNQHQKHLKTKYGFKEDDFIIFNYGRNSNIRKNNHGLLWIMAKYLSEAPDNHKFLFHTLEPQFPGNDLFDYVNRHLTIEFGEDVTKNIIFTPFRAQNAPSDNQMAEMMQVSDLVVTASIGEGFGLIMAEAMACGKPVISNNYTTPHELLIDESNGIGPRGWVVEPDTRFVAALNTEHAYTDKESFVGTIHEVVNNPELMKAYGRNGRAFAEHYLNWDYLVDEWATLLRGL